MSQSDPTDHALAAIASILDQPESVSEPEPESVSEPEKAADEEQLVILPERTEADGYSKVGPGPMEAIRFKWTVRREDNGQYFVDETIGENSRPVTNGPMLADEAVRFVDGREIDARQRFERLKIEMSTRAPVANVIRHEGGEM